MNLQFFVIFHGGKNGIQAEIIDTLIFAGARRFQDQTSSLNGQNAP
jgi:hypothetical protein